MALLARYDALRREIDQLLAENEELKQLVQLLREGQELRSLLQSQISDSDQADSLSWDYGGLLPISTTRGCARQRIPTDAWAPLPYNRPALRSRQDSIPSNLEISQHCFECALPRHPHSTFQTISEHSFTPTFEGSIPSTINLSDATSVFWPYPYPYPSPELPKVYVYIRRPDPSPVSCSSPVANRTITIGTPSPAAGGTFCASDPYISRSIPSTVNLTDASSVFWPTPAGAGAANRTVTIGTPSPAARGTFCASDPYISRSIPSTVNLTDASSVFWPTPAGAGAANRTVTIGTPSPAGGTFCVCDPGASRSIPSTVNLSDATSVFWPYPYPYPSPELPKVYVYIRRPDPSPASCSSPVAGLPSAAGTYSAGNVSPEAYVDLPIPSPGNLSDAASVFCSSPLAAGTPISNRTFGAGSPSPGAFCISDPCAARSIPSPIQPQPRPAMTPPTPINLSEATSVFLPYGSTPTNQNAYLEASFTRPGTAAVYRNWWEGRPASPQVVPHYAGCFPVMPFCQLQNLSMAHGLANALRQADMLDPAHEQIMMQMMNQAEMELAARAAQLAMYPRTQPHSVSLTQALGRQMAQAMAFYPEEAQMIMDVIEGTRAGIDAHERAQARTQALAWAQAQAQTQALAHHRAQSMERAVEQARLTNPQAAQKMRQTLGIMEAGQEAMRHLKNTMMKCSRNVTDVHSMALARVQRRAQALAQAQAQAQAAQSPLSAMYFQPAGSPMPSPVPAVCFSAGSPGQSPLPSAYFQSGGSPGQSPLPSAYFQSGGSPGQSPLPSAYFQCGGSPGQTPLSSTYFTPAGSGNLSMLPPMYFQGSQDRSADMSPNQDTLRTSSDPRCKETSKQERIIGEIAFQLDRRILSRIFPDRVRLYGFTVRNIPEKVAQSGKDPFLKLSPEESKAIMERYNRVMDRLRSMNYDPNIHPRLTEHIVNTFGILRDRPDTPGPDPNSSSDIQHLTEVIKTTAPPDLQGDCLLLLKCLQQLALEDGKPMFIW